MSPASEREARASIDRLLEMSGRPMRDTKAVNIRVRQGVAIRQSPFKPGHRNSDHVRNSGRLAAGVVEATKANPKRTGIEIYAERSAQDLPDSFPACFRLPGLDYQFSARSKIGVERIGDLRLNSVQPVEIATVGR